jgi:hypothetical protein
LASCALPRAAKELKNPKVFPLPGSPQPAAARALDRRLRHTGHPRKRLRGPLPLLRHTPLPPLPRVGPGCVAGLDPGPRGTAPRSATGCRVVCRLDAVLAPRPWPLDPGSSTLASRSWPLDPGPSTLAPRPWPLDPGPSTAPTGCCFLVGIRSDVTCRSWGWGSLPLASMPNSSYMLPMRSCGSPAGSRTASPLASEAPTPCRP